MAASVRTAFGNVLRDLREDRGLSQEALSFECGRHRTYVSLLERGQSSPTLDTVWMLAGALRISPVEMMRQIERRAPAPRSGRRRR